LEGTGRGRSPPRPLIAVPNVAAHPSTASVPNHRIQYNGALFCGYNVPMKGLTVRAKTHCDGTDTFSVRSHFAAACMWCGIIGNTAL